MCIRMKAFYIQDVLIGRRVDMNSILIFWITTLGCCLNDVFVILLRIAIQWSLKYGEKLSYLINKHIIDLTFSKLDLAFLVQLFCFCRLQWAYAAVCIFTGRRLEWKHVRIFIYHWAFCKIDFLTCISYQESLTELNKVRYTDVQSSIPFVSHSRR